jgi:hypothetical protein
MENFNSALSQLHNEKCGVYKYTRSCSTPSGAFYYRNYYRAQEALTSILYVLPLRETYAPSICHTINTMILI